MANRDFLACIIGKAQADRLSQRAAAELQRLHGEARAQLVGKHADDVIDKMAADAVLAAQQDQLARRKFKLSLQAKAKDRIDANLDGHPGGVLQSGQAHVARDRSGLAGHGSMEGRQMATLKQMSGKLEDFFRHVHPRGVFGTVDQVKAKSVIYSILGDARGKGAEKAAAAYTKASQYGQARLRAAGALQRTLDGYVPQHHDARAINGLIKEKLNAGLRDAEAIAAARQDYVDFVIPKLDAARMIDFETGLPMSETMMREIVADTFDNVRTRGLAKSSSGARGGATLADRYSQARVLHFKDADSFFEYDMKFGSHGDYYGLLLGHIKNQARDIGTLETFGPDPDGMARYIQDRMAKAQAVEGKSVTGTVGERLFSAATPTTFMRQYEIGAGVHESVTGDGAIGRFLQDGRNVLVSAQLGGAAISAFSDVALQSKARQLYGLSQRGIFADYFRALGEKDVEFANKIGLGAEVWIEQAYAAHRIAGELMGSGWSRKAADITMRASGLSSFTQAGRHSIGLEILREMAAIKDTAFTKLPDQWQAMMGRVGIGAEDWNAIRKAPLAEHRGQKFIDAAAVANAGNVESGSKLLEYISNAMEMAAPHGDLHTRMIMSLGQQPGTLSAEIARSVMMYKGFPIAVLNTHFAEMMTRQGLGSKFSYIAPLFVQMSLYGALALQAKEVLKGRDPLPMDPFGGEGGNTFWGRAMLQGGGLGIMGDFLFADQNRFGDSFGETLAGPFTSAIDDIILKFGVGNVQQAIGAMMRGENIAEETDVGKELAQLMRRYTPGSSLWYLRAALDRAIFDNIELMLDPGAPDRYRRAQRKAEREFNQGSWWPRGGVLPNRSPEFGNTLN